MDFEFSCLLPFDRLNLLNLSFSKVVLNRPIQFSISLNETSVFDSVQCRFLHYLPLPEFDFFLR